MDNKTKKAISDTYFYKYKNDASFFTSKGLFSNVMKERDFYINNKEKIQKNPAYQNKYIAIKNNRVVDVADTCDLLFEKLKRSKIPHPCLIIHII